MKTTVLTTGLLMLAAFSVKAQETVFIQDFEDIESVEEQQWGAIDMNNDEVTFGFIQSQPILGQLGFTGNVMGTTNFNFDDENNPVVIDGSDDLLLTPVIALPDEENLSLTFRLCGIGNTTEALSAYQVYVANAADLETLETVDDILAYFETVSPIAEDAVNGMSFEITHDLADFQGEEIVVIIRHNESVGPTYLFADDFTVTSGLLSTGPELTASFSVYPNPTADLIQIENTLGASLETITVTDANGRTVKTANANGEQNTSVDLSNLAAGSYFISIATDRGTVMKQVIRK